MSNGIPHAGAASEKFPPSISRDTTSSMWDDNLYPRPFEHKCLKLWEFLNYKSNLSLTFGRFSIQNVTSKFEVGLVLIGLINEASVTFTEFYCKPSTKIWVATAFLPSNSVCLWIEVVACLILLSNVDTDSYCLSNTHCYTSCTEKDLTECNSSYVLKHSSCYIQFRYRLGIFTPPYL